MVALLRMRLALGHEIKGSTETVDVERATAIVAEYWPNGFTVYNATGRWRDPESGRVVAESSTVFEAVAHNASAEQTGPGSALGHARKLAEALATTFRQDAVMLTAEPVSVFEFVPAAKSAV